MALPAPNLRLAAVRIQDFRAIADLYVPLAKGTTVLIGMNNVGKTAFLAALDVAIGRGRSSVHDLRVAPSTSPNYFLIDLRFEPMSGDTFLQPVVDVVGTGIQLGAGGDCDYFVIRTRGERDPKKTDPTTRRTFLKDWETTRAKADALADHPSAVVTADVRNLVNYELLGAQRDGVAQLRNKRTHWGRAVADLQLDPKVRSEVETSLVALKDKVVGGSQPLQDLHTELSDVAGVLGRPDVKVEIEAIPTEADDLLRSMELLLTEAGQGALPLVAQGMGTRSLTALLIFRGYLSATLKALSPTGSLSLSSFEEPESHLHPQAQKAVLSLLEKVPGQRIFSTHSAIVASAADLLSIRILRREANGPEATWLKDGVLDVEGLTMARRFIQRRNADILFSRVVGLYEGDTEDAAIPLLADAHFGTSAGGKGISFVNVEGAGNYKHFLALLEELKIPWVILADGDPAGVNGLAAASRAINKALPHGPDVEIVGTGRDFEQAVLAAGLRAQAEAAIATYFGATALTDWKTRRNGSPMRGGALRDFTSAGWEERLVLDFMGANKGHYGAALADELIKRSAVPAFATSFFRKLSAKIPAPK